VRKDIGLVSFMGDDLGYFGPETRVFEPLENSFGPRVSPMSPGWTQKSLARPEGFEPPTYGSGGRRSIR
jgi:hypothetical protein